MGEVDGDTLVTLGGLDETGVSGELELSEETELERRRWCPEVSIGIGVEWVSCSGFMVVSVRETDK